MHNFVLLPCLSMPIPHCALFSNGLNNPVSSPASKIAPLYANLGHCMSPSQTTQAHLGEALVESVAGEPNQT